MLKTATSALVLLLSSSTFAMTMTCPPAVPDSSSNFCSSFKSVAHCYCTSAGLPSFMCKDMGKIYSRMVALYGSVQKACAHQRHTSAQECIDDWQCYLKGGKDSKNQLCNGTGRSCE